MHLKLSLSHFVYEEGKISFFFLLCLCGYLPLNNLRCSLLDFDARLEHEGKAVILNQGKGGYQAFWVLRVCLSHDLSLLLLNHHHRMLCLSFPVNLRYSRSSPHLLKQADLSKPFKNQDPPWFLIHTMRGSWVVIFGQLSIVTLKTKQGTSNGKELLNKPFPSYNFTLHAYNQ